MTTGHQPDLCHGIEEIGSHLGLTPRQTKHLHENGDLPTFRIGRSVCALRSKLNAWLAEKSAEIARFEGEGGAPAKDGAE